MKKMWRLARFAASVCGVEGGRYPQIHDRNDTLEFVGLDHATQGIACASR